MAWKIRVPFDLYPKPKSKTIVNMGQEFRVRLLLGGVGFIILGNYQEYSIEFVMVFNSFYNFHLTLK